MEYLYDNEFQPPALVLNIDVSDLLQERRIEKVSCKIDTGADMTVISENVVASLKLTPIKIIPVRDYYGKIIEQELYLAKLLLLNCEFNVEIITTAEKIGFIGRDILNQWVILLDSPRKRFNMTKKAWKLWNLLIVKR
ncbi:MAG: hypothetical protein AB1595_02755 [bacterium]